MIREVARKSLLQRGNRKVINTWYKITKLSVERVKGTEFMGCRGEERQAW